MGENPVKIFSLAEANQAVRKVHRLTRQVVLKVERVRRRYGAAGEGSELPAAALNEIEGLLRGWAEKVQALGALPKGYFTIDFQSADPGLFYCWTYGEDQIAYTHKVWENFSHRRPLLESMPVEEAHMKWVN
jgi:hypothetical protein